MATITLGNSYRFKDYNNNKYLNILVNGNPANNSNVTIYSLDSADMGQVWKCDHHSGANVSGVLMKSAKDTSFALDRWRGSSNYNNADVYKIGTTDADLQDQLVEFLPISNGYYRIKLVYADLYLTVSTTTAYGGYNVNWQAITGNADQLWAAELYSVSSSATPEPTPTAIKDKEFFVKAYGTNLNLNVYGTDTVANARNVNAYEKEDCLAQRWIAKQTSAGPKLFTKINQSYALNINTADNNCTMYTASGNDNDSVLEFEEAGDMLYRIKMFKYGKYLTVNGSTSGSNVVWPDYSSTATLWEFIPEDVMFPSAPKAPDAPEGIVGNTYAVQANGTDFYLNVHGTDTVADGRNVNIYSKDDCLAQRWFIKNTDNGPKLFTKVNEEVGYTLNIYTTDDNCTMYTDSTENDADSILEFVSVGNMLYRIKMYHHDKYLCIDGAAASGANVKWISGASSATVWKLVPEATAFPTPASAPATIVGKTFFIKNYNTGYNLNVHGTNTVALGRNVNVFAKEPEDSQRWQVVQTPKGPKIITEINPDFALNIHVENSNNCVMYDINDNNVDSVIEFVPYDENKNIYKLKMFHHNKYLEAAGVGSGFNAYWSDSPVYNLWQFVEEDDMFPVASAASSGIVDKTYYIQNVNTGHYLNVNGTDTVANARNVNVYAKEDCQAQRWVIRNKNGGPKLVTKINEAFAINIYANDNNCTMYVEEGNDIDSVLQFIPYTTGQTEASENIYRIKMHYHNRYLTVASTNIGANAYWTSVDTEPYALWRLIPESEMTFETVTPTEADSPLVTKFIPADTSNYTACPDGRTISAITIHHTAGNISIDTLGAMWQNPEENASSHYGVRGTQVGQFVNERDIAWTNKHESNSWSVTIETANSINEYPWTVSDDTYYTLVRLVADIAKRNNLGTLVVGENLTWHSMYASTECPGPYLLARMQDIADRANDINSKIYLRKQYSDKFLSINDNNELIWSDKFHATPWYYSESSNNISIKTSNNDTLYLTVDEDFETPIISNAPSEQINITFNSVRDNIVNIISNGISQTALLNVENTKTLACTTEGFKYTDYIADFLVKQTNNDVMLEEPVPSIIESDILSKPFKIKHSYTGTYLEMLFDPATLSTCYDPDFVSGPYIPEDIDSSTPTEYEYNLNIDANKKILRLRNPSDNSGQFWKMKEFATGVSGLISTIDERYALETNDSNEIIIAKRVGSVDPNTMANMGISFEKNNDGKYAIKLSSSEGRYLTAYSKEYDFHIRWASSPVYAWDIEFPEYIVLGDWLEMYLEPQIKGKDNAKKQTRKIPTEKFYNGKDSFSDINRYGSTIPYSFTDTKYWYTSEGSFSPEHNFINKHAYEVIIDKDTGEPMGIDCKKNAVRNMDKYYYIAVGPKVIHKNYPAFGNPGNDIDSNGAPTHIMYNNGTIDIVVKDFKDTLYHIRAVVGDVKAHTYDNGIVQTYHSYPDGALAPKRELPTGDFYDGLVCAEFIFKTDNYFRLNYDNLINTLGRYDIVNIIFYPNDNYIPSTETTI